MQLHRASTRCGIPIRCPVQRSAGTTREVRDVVKVKVKATRAAWPMALDNQQGPLQVFLANSAVSIDNNAAERGPRRATIGRDLWLFFRDQDKSSRPDSRTSPGS